MLNSDIVRLSRRRFAAMLGGSLGVECLHAISPRTKLYILLVAEQFRPDYLSQLTNQLGPAGFRRLMEEGAYLPDCRMASSSFSSTGLATLATGAYPHAHGIVAESWYDPARGKIIGANSMLTGAGTLADQVALAGGGNRVFALGMTRSQTELLVRSATYGSLDHRILTLETPPDAAEELWWLKVFRESHAPERFRDAKWQGLQAESNAPPLRVLLYDSNHPAEFDALYNASPFAQETQFDLLRALITEEKLGQGPGVDFVVVALNSMALLGYEVGADSPLMREMALQLDRQMEATLQALNKTPGSGGFSLVFTAAHGAPDHGAKPIDGEAVAQAIDSALSSAFDVSPVKNRYVERYVYPFVYLNHKQLRRYGIDPQKARRLAGEAALRQAPGVAAYYTADGDCSQSGEWLRRFRNSFHAVRCGDLMLSYEPHAVERYGSGRGISYGSLYNYDVRTPLICYGPQFRPGAVESAADAVDVAPTLARAMQIGTPTSSTGRVLAEVLK
jgi:hypothetical protein